MRVAITGSTGQLGSALAATLAGLHQVLPLARPRYDVTRDDIAGLIAELEPELVVHTAAMTDVDGCARDPEAALAVNAEGTRRVAEGCREAGCALLYISTNEVFDGRQEAPYHEDDEPHPINVYGRSKLEGERYAASLVEQVGIVRTSWLFGPGKANFVTKILERVHAGQPLRVVTDERASPTYVPDLAAALARLIDSDARGIFHLTNSGACSRYEYALRIVELARPGVVVEPIGLAEYQRDSTPPRQSALHNGRAAALGIALRPWQEALQDYLQTEVLGFPASGT